MTKINVMERTVSVRMLQDLGFCNGGVKDAMERLGMNPMRDTEMTLRSLVRYMDALPGEQQREWLNRYGYEFDKLARHLGAGHYSEFFTVEAGPNWWGQPLGSPVGKPEYVSGKTAYEQTFSSGAVLCISYTTIVGAFVPGFGSFRTNRKYSVTTSKHMSRFPSIRGRGEEATPEQLETLGRSYCKQAAPVTRYY